MALYVWRLKLRNPWCAVQMASGTSHLQKGILDVVRFWFNTAEIMPRIVLLSPWVVIHSSVPTHSDPMSREKKQDKLIKFGATQVQLKYSPPLARIVLSESALEPIATLPAAGLWLRELWEVGNTPSEVTSVVSDLPLPAAVCLVSGIEKDLCEETMTWVKEFSGSLLLNILSDVSLP